MTTLFLIRHAEYEGIGHYIAGRSPGVHLSEGGREQAEKLVSRLSGVPFTAVYSSPLERCRETAAPLARALGLEVIVRAGLTELDFGAWNGLTIEELRRLPRFAAFNFFRAGTRPPGGELMLEAQARMIAELDRLRAENENGTLAVFTHGDPLKSVIAHFLGMPIDFLYRLEIGPASISVLTLTTEGASIVRVNDADRLVAS